MDRWGTVAGVRSFAEHERMLTFLRTRLAQPDCCGDGRHWIVLLDTHENMTRGDVVLTFGADRDVLDEDRASDLAWTVAYDLKRAIPELEDHVEVSTVPRRHAVDPADEERRRAVHEFLRAHLASHERECPVHRERPGYLFIDTIDVTLEVGWKPFQDHLRAKFSVDSSGPDVEDELCCARAIAALLRSRSDADALLWSCGPWK